MNRFQASYDAGKALFEAEYNAGKDCDYVSPYPWLGFSSSCRGRWFGIEKGEFVILCDDGSEAKRFNINGIRELHYCSCANRSGIMLVGDIDKELAIGASLPLYMAFKNEEQVSEAVIELTAADPSMQVHSRYETHIDQIFKQNCRPSHQNHHMRFFQGDWCGKSDTADDSILAIKFENLLGISKRHRAEGAATTRILQTIAHVRGCSHILPAPITSPITSDNDSEGTYTSSCLRTGSEDSNYVDGRNYNKDTEGGNEGDGEAITLSNRNRRSSTQAEGISKRPRESSSEDTDSSEVTSEEIRYLGGGAEYNEEDIADNSESCSKSSSDKDNDDDEEVIAPNSQGNKTSTHVRRNNKRNLISSSEAETTDGSSSGVQESGDEDGDENEEKAFAAKPQNGRSGTQNRRINKGPRVNSSEDEAADGSESSYRDSEDNDGSNHKDDDDDPAPATITSKGKRAGEVGRSCIIYFNGPRGQKTKKAARKAPPAKRRRVA